MIAYWKYGMCLWCTSIPSWHCEIWHWSNFDHSLTPWRQWCCKRKTQICLIRPYREKQYLVWGHTNLFTVEAIRNLSHTALLLMQIAKPATTSLPVMHFKLMSTFHLGWMQVVSTHCDMSIRTTDEMLDLCAERITTEHNSYCWELLSWIKWCKADIYTGSKVQYVGSQFLKRIFPGS